ncbi:MAG: ABC transporter permease [Acidobacteriota bacterium]|nr:MAG: ABC transporter permease [Acidobacteriota bacterium]
MALKVENIEAPDAGVPHLVIEPDRSRLALDLRDLWRYRELFYFLTWRDIKVRYKQTALGAAWAIMQPLFTMLLFTLIFGKLAGLPSDNIPYPLFAFAGLLPWTFFSNAISNSGNSLVGSSHLITKVYFPRLIIPAASVLAGLVDFFFAFAVMGVLMVVYRAPLGINILLLPLLVGLTTLLAFGVGMWLSALNVRFRDIRYVIPFLIQFWMFATPIIYPASMMPERWRPLLSLNPMTGIIEGYRAALLGGINGASVNWQSLGLSIGIALAVLIYALYDFRRMEKTFADIV